VRALSFLAAAAAPHYQAVAALIARAVGVPEPELVQPGLARLRDAVADPRPAVAFLCGLPYVRLRSVFDSDDVPAARAYVVVVRGAFGRAGLCVDALHGECQAVIKPLDPVFRRLPGISGSTLLGDGRIALILDVGLLLDGIGARAGAAA